MILWLRFDLRSKCVIQKVCLAITWFVSYEWTWIDSLDKVWRFKSTSKLSVTNLHEKLQRNTYLKSGTKFNDLINKKIYTLSLKNKHFSVTNKSQFLHSYFKVMLFCYRNIRCQALSQSIYTIENRIIFFPALQVRLNQGGKESR